MGLSHVGLCRLICYPFVEWLVKPTVSLLQAKKCLILATRSFDSNAACYRM